MTYYVDDDDELIKAIKRDNDARAKAEQEAWDTDLSELIYAKLADKYAVQYEAPDDVTLETHIAAFKPFHDFCKEVWATSLPAKSGIVASYLHENIGLGIEWIKHQLEAIKFAHLGHPDPTSDPLVRAIVQRAREDDLIAKAMQPKEK
jgi:hypothetical protein